MFNETNSLHTLTYVDIFCGSDKKNVIWNKTKHHKGHGVIAHSVGSRPGQALERFSLATHEVFARARCDVDAALSEIEVLSGFVPVKDGEVELVAAGGQAELWAGRVKQEVRHEEREEEKHCIYFIHCHI